MKDLARTSSNPIFLAATFCQSLLKIALSFFGVVLAATAFQLNAVAQTTNPTDGMTPLALQAGAPAGSYMLSGFDNVNLYNGNLNFALPLLSISGRGGASHTIMLPIERKWMVEKTVSGDYTWTIPTDSRAEEIKPGYGPGVMAWRFGGSLAATPCPTPPQWNPQDPWDNYRYYSGLMRLSFTGPDGTETEFRDVATGGQAQMTANYCDNNPGYKRGKVFVSVDGSGTTFISDFDIHDEVMVGSQAEGYGVAGYMYLRDGTVYRFDAMAGGMVSWIRDRNGNKISFEYDVYRRATAITDSLNRQVTIVYDYNEGGSYGVCDKITYKGFGGATRVIRISKTALANALRSGYSLTTLYNLFPGLSGDGINNYNPTVVSSVWLPDADGVTRRYQFQYNNYGELARVVLPTGGAYEYDFGGGTTDTSSAAGVLGSYPNYQIYRRIHERRIYANGSNLTSRATYSLPETQSGGGIATVGYVTVQQYDTNNNLLPISKHYFQGPGAAPSLSQAPNLLAPLTDGREYQTDLIDTNGTTVLRRSVSTWAAGTPIATNSSVNINYRVTQTVSTLEPSGANLVSKQTFSYDQYNNRIDTYEYDFGSGAAGSLVRRTSTSFVTTNNSYDYACDPSSTCSSSANPSNVIHIRNLPAQISIYDSGGTLKANTSFEYDNYAADTNHAGLIDRSSISGLDSGFTTTYSKRGNVTGTTRYLIVSGALPNCAGSPSSCLAGYAQYDIAGNVVKTIDARGYATTLDFADRFGAPDGDAEANSSPAELSTPGKVSYAFATKVTNALNQSAYVQFDYYLGKPVDGEDVNGVVASGYYNDALDRPTKVIRAYGTGLQNQTVFSYDDANRTITTASDLTTNTDGVLLSKLIYDALGRTSESRQYEGGSNYIAVQTEYDALGRAYRSSNPFRPWLSESAVWTTSVFDALGRVTSVTTPDGATVTTSYLSNTVTVTDQAGKARKSVTDALGRLTTVYEDPAGLNYQTSYSYDVLDDLTSVSQGSQTRTFVYDSLKRLASATNPESATLSYSYDANSNLTSKTDARSISTSYTYDAVNRVATRSYSDGTPTVTYSYDSASVTNSKGRLTFVSCSVSTTNYTAYDSLGRITAANQVTDSQTYSMSYGYNLAGGRTSMTYPSGRVITSAYDEAGRLAGVRDQASGIYYAGGASTDTTNRMQYAAHGAVSVMKLGNGLWEHTNFNNRLQPTEIGLGTSSTSTSIVGLAYNYGTTNNNGNVLSLGYSGGGLSYTQGLGYDALNRLTTSSESGSAWSQTNGYDQYGNRWIDYGGGVHNLSFSTSTNRITTSGYSYDAAGNLTSDTFHSYGFDAENKIKSVDGVSDVYRYDGDGNRVRKNFTSGDKLRLVYSAGQLIAEYDLSNGSLKKEYIYGAKGLVATIEPTNGTRYTTSDHLGSPRIVTNSSAAVVSRHDFMPFGEEVGAGIGGRTNGMGFGTADGLRQQFTQKERDTETGLDYFGARYYAGLQGRFTSADPLMASGRASVPQSWNRYSYVHNNPSKLIDPNGLEDDDPQNPNTKKDTDAQQPKQTPSESSLPKVTVKISADPGTTNGTVPRANVRLQSGDFATGVVAPLTITITDQSDNPLQGLTVTETNKVLEAEPSLQFKENQSTVTTDAQGSFTDVVFGNGTVTSNKVSPQEATQIVQNQVESRVKVVTEQTLTISAPGRGVIATAAYQRTITNLYDNGTRRPAFDSSGRYINNFSISVTPVTVSRPKSP